MHDARTHARFIRCGGTPPLLLPYMRLVGMSTCNNLSTCIITKAGDGNSCISLDCSMIYQHDKLLNQCAEKIKSVESVVEMVLSLVVASISLLSC